MRITIVISDLMFIRAARIIRSVMAIGAVMIISATHNASSQELALVHSCTR